MNSDSRTHPVWQQEDRVIAGGGIAKAAGGRIGWPGGVFVLFWPEEVG